jgi:hypothetical protein
VDFRKAFDSLPINILINKLHNIGIKGKLLSWLSEFLKDRFYRVKINNKFSNLYPIQSGVPQGSVLGPLLFLIYINDLPQVIPPGVSIKLFADDVKIYVSYKTRDERSKLNVALDNIGKWANAFGLNISQNKTFILFLGKNNSKQQYKLFNNIINEVESISDLGILIDNKLRFSNHYTKIIKAAYLRIRNIAKILKTRSIRIWTKVFKTYIRPLLEYAPEIWNPTYKKDINKLERCQKYFTKIALFKCRLPYIPYEQRLDLFKLQTLEERRKTIDLVQAFKIINGLTHLKKDIFPQFSGHIPYNLRRKVVLKSQSSKTSNSFINRTALIWSKLNKDITDAPSVDSFKKRINKWIELNKNLVCKRAPWT